MVSTPRGILGVGSGSTSVKAVSPRSMPIDAGHPASEPAVGSNSAPSSENENRKDLPQVNTLTRGNKKRAFEALEDKEKSLAEFNRGKFAAFSVDSRDSLWKTWMEFHTA